VSEGSQLFDVWFAGGAGMGELCNGGPKRRRGSMQRQQRAAGQQSSRAAGQQSRTARTLEGAGRAERCCELDERACNGEGGVCAAAIGGCRGGWTGALQERFTENTGRATRL
jgi:hypothetical protein